MAQGVGRGAGMPGAGMLDRRQAMAGALAWGAWAAVARAQEGGRAAAPELAALYDRMVAEGKIAGAVGAIGRADGPPIYVTAGRHAMGAGPAVTPRSIFRIFSMTKPLTGMTAMALIEEGRLRLDQPIADFIPEFAAPQVLADPATGATRPAARAITVRHLLTHTSGLIYHFNESGPPALRDRYMKEGLTPGLRGLTPPRPGDKAEPASLAEFGARLAAAPLADDPGVSWRYGASLDLLGLVIERAAGVSFERAMQDRLLGPLGMADTAWAAPAKDAARLTALYAVTPDQPQPALADPIAESKFLTPAPYPSGGGGLVSTAEDYAHFARMLLREGRGAGGRVLKRRTVRLGGSNLLPAGVPGDRGQHHGAGMGVRVAGPDQPRDGQSPGAFGWGGAAGTNMFVDPARGFYFVHMVQLLPFVAHGLYAAAGAAAAEAAQRGFDTRV